MPDRAPPAVEEVVDLAECTLRFSALAEVTLRAYDSTTTTWADVPFSDPPIESVGEVEVEQSLWKLTGFAADGRWIEWRFRAVGAVVLSGATNA